ncbi:hypothetical protein M422DRAFT_27719, partial [Sphaerobolus stellatus SS14]
MSRNEEFAVACTLSEISDNWGGKKIRTIGKTLSYEPSTCLLLLADPPHGLLVDMTLCLDPSQSLSYFQESKSTLMLIGTLERTESTSEIPTLPKFIEPPIVDGRLVLHAILARNVNDIHLEEWRVGVESIRQTS